MRSSGEESFWRREGNLILLNVKVVSNSSKNSVEGVEDNYLKIKITALPEKGRANRELVRFLASLLGVRKSSVTVSKGRTSRFKTITIASNLPEDKLKLLANLTKGGKL